jgi:hypothetical protein
MLRKDFILVQIEELGKAIASIISNRFSGAESSNPALIASVYSSLRISRDDILLAPAADLHSFLDGDDGCGLRRMDIAARLLLEDAAITASSSEKYSMRAKALEMLEYIHSRDTTFSLERAMMIDELRSDSSHIY